MIFSQVLSGDIMIEFWHHVKRACIVKPLRLATRWFCNFTCTFIFVPFILHWLRDWSHFNAGAQQQLVWKFLPFNFASQKWRSCERDGFYSKLCWLSLWL